MGFSRITIIRQSKPKSRSINEELQWFGASLGLFGLRDKDKSCFRIFIVLIKQLNQKRGLTSDELAAMLSLTRGTVIHHLNKLIDSGFVVSERGKYILRANSLAELINSIKQNTSSYFEELEKAAKALDERLKE